MTEKVVCFDGEGVLWLKGNSIKRANTNVDKIKQLGYRTICISNNSASSASEYLQRFYNNGFNSFGEEDVVPAARCVVAFIREKKLNNKKHKFFVIGAQGFITQIKKANIDVLSVSDYENLEINDINLDPDVCAVIVGTCLDFNERHIAIAARYVNEKSVELVSASPDSTAYRQCKQIVEATRKKEIILGKPLKVMYHAISGYENIDTKNSWMIGDKIRTDIKFAKNAGLNSILVLTGDTSIDDLANFEKEELPDYVCKDLDECYELIKSKNI